MWYSDTLENIEYSHFISLCELYEKSRFAGDSTGLSFNILISGIKMGMRMLQKLQPSYAGPIGAMLHYLDGSGKPVELDKKYIPPKLASQILKEYLLNEEGGGSKVFNYSDYPRDLDYQDEFSGKKLVNPVKYIIGGFTPHIETLIDDNGGVHIRLKFEDDYDWGENNSRITLQLGQLGLDNPTFIKIVNKISEIYPDLLDYETATKSLSIKDSFWLFLEKSGFAKSYTHYFDAEVLSLSPGEIEGYNTPEEQIKALTKLNLVDADTPQLLDYIIDNKIDIIKNYNDGIINIYIRNWIYNNTRSTDYIKYFIEKTKIESILDFSGLLRATFQSDNVDFFVYLESINPDKVYNRLNDFEIGPNIILYIFRNIPSKLDTFLVYKMIISIISKSNNGLFLEDILLLLFSKYEELGGNVLLILSKNSNDFALSCYLKLHPEVNELDLLKDPNCDGYLLKNIVEKNYDKIIKSSDEYFNNIYNIIYSKNSYIARNLFDIRRDIVQSDQDLYIESEN